MQTAKAGTKSTAIGTYLLFTTLLCSVFYFLILKNGSLRGGNGLYVTGIMWCPAIAAILTLKVKGRKFAELGWGFNDKRILLFSYMVPLAYAFLSYLIIWMTGLGKFYNQETVSAWTRNLGLGNLPPWVVIVLNVALTGTIGMVRSTATALGEEIGWRGFLVPELYKRFSYTKTSFITGVVWSIFHYPILIFADYNNGTPVWFGLGCFTIMVISSCFIFSWFRLKSGSLWPAAIMHASHNLFIQAVFTPLTVDTGDTKYFIDEFGIVLAIASVIFGFYFWTRRKELNELRAG